MSEDHVDPMLLHAWLSARSLARRLPAPVPDRGGFRVDTNSAGEVRRWVFPKLDSCLVDVARTIRAPRTFLKCCTAAGDLRGALSGRWQLHAQAYFMIAEGDWSPRSVPQGYALEVEQADGVSQVRVWAGPNNLAASGYAAETGNAFIYDRIVTAPGHRRRGLAAAVMTALHRQRQNTDIPQLLVATEDGRALYRCLGWRILSPYSTASLAEV